MFRWLLPLLACLLSLDAFAADPLWLERYQSELKPLFRQRCFSCHGALDQQSGLRVDTVASMIEAGVLEPGAAEASALFERVTSDDESMRMPPPHEGEPFSAEERETLKQWIEAGAPAPEAEVPESDPQDHWAFQPVTRPAIPEMTAAIQSPQTASPQVAASIANPIDAFLALRQREQGLMPLERADPLTQLRRVYFDLIGVPPTEPEIRSWLEDPSDEHWQTITRRLLDDPRHGQRWARHWMDVWRYSDWWGLGAQLRNSQKHIWHYRDWIVESLNDDTPYDEMVRCMLAADELYPGDLQRLRATGFLARNFFLFNRNQWMEETVEHVSKGLMGLTVNCAKCHDHKYDPIEQVDFYRLRAFFEPYQVRHEMIPGQVDIDADAIPRVFDAAPNAKTYRLVRGEEGNPDQSRVISPGVPEVLAFGDLQINAVPLPPVAWEPARREGVLQGYQRQAASKLEQALERRIAFLGEQSEAVASELSALQRDSDPASEPDGESVETLATTSVAPAVSTTGDTTADAPQRAEIPNEVRLRWQVIEADVALAQSQRELMEIRVSATRAEWSEGPNESDPEQSPRETVSRELIEQVWQAEQESELQSARRSVAEIGLRLATAEEGQRAAIEDELKKADEAVEQAEKRLAAGCPEDAQFTPLAGARWCATRFQFSGKDDPAPSYPEASTGRRTALAEWLTDPRHPLTARVAVNHIWNRHMGSPLVPSMFDFGRNGAAPTHPDLLDWLAAEWIESGWSMKHMHSLIVSSEAYRRGSSLAGQQANLQIDPENRLLWRRTPQRLESQVLRDAVLAHAGQLDCQLGGPPILAAQQPESRRRSLYFFHSKNEKNQFLATFDEARVTDCYRREQSVVPQQALAMSHSQLVLDAASVVAKRLSDLDHGEATRDETAFARTAFEVLLGFTPGDAEIAASQQALEEWRAINGGDDAAARGRLIWTLMNHNDFVTIR